MTAADNICECCKRKVDKIVGVASVPGFPVSIAWCRECLDNNALPMYCIEYIACDGDLSIKESFEKWSITSMAQMQFAPWFLQSNVFVDDKYVRIYDFLVKQLPKEQD